MKITDSSYTIITDLAPKVIETANGFLLNTQYYTKEKLVPVPFETCDLYGSPYSVSTRKQLYLQGFAWNDHNDESGIFRDSTYPNRYYMRVLSGFIAGTRRSCMIVFEEDDFGNVKILYEYNMGDWQFVDYVDQNDYYIYFSARSNTTFALYYMDKRTFGVGELYRNSYGYNYARFHKIYSDDLNTYMMFYGNQHMYAAILNKNSHAVTVSAAIQRGGMTGAGAYYLTNLCDTPYEVSDDIHGLFLCNIQDPEQPIDFYQFDSSKTLAEGFSMVETTIAWGNGKDKVDFFNTCMSINNSLYTTARSFIAEFNGIKYLNLVVYRTNFEHANFIATQGIYTFRINSEKSLTFTGYNQVDATKQFQGFIYDESKEHLLIAKQNCFQILRFNQTAQKYESTNFEVTNCYSVGLDELQRIWYVKTDSSVHMINMEDAQSVEIEFEKEYYDYTGTTISTYINFSALNYLGKDFAGIFELTLSGPAVFSENNSSTLRFMYNGSGKQQIGIIITGASPITVYPKFVS